MISRVMLRLSSVATLLSVPAVMLILLPARMLELLFVTVPRALLPVVMVTSPAAMIVLAPLLVLTLSSPPAVAGR